MKLAWEIIIHKGLSNKPITIRINHLLKAVISIFFIFFLTAFTLTSIYVLQNHYKIKKAETVLEENQLLQQKFTDLSAKLDSIQNKLQQMENWEDQIRSEQNFKQIDKEIRDMGMGGLPKIDSTFSKFSKDFHTQYNVILFQLEQLESKTNFDFQTHTELFENIELKEALYRNTPSIYPTYGRISEGFGWRIHPISKKRSYHYGLDFANRLGTPIYATADGTVKQTGRKKNFGRYIHLDHQFGYETKYAHLSKIFVKKGQKVTRGEIIGTLGNTGRSTGPHLHYEVIRYSKYRNPYRYLNKSKEDIILSKK